MHRGLFFPGKDEGVHFSGGDVNKATRRIAAAIVALAAVLALLISLFTIGYRAIRAASANPTKSLRAS